jgi:hypothetical protein
MLRLGAPEPYSLWDSQGRPLGVLRVNATVLRARSRDLATLLLCKGLSGNPAVPVSLSLDLAADAA